MNANELRRQRRGEESDQDDCDEELRDLVTASRGRMSHERFHGVQHECDVDDREGRRENRPRDIFRFHESHDDRENAPRRHVVDGGARDGDHAHVCLEKTALDENAGEHGTTMLA